jgi:glutathione synthase
MAGLVVAVQMDPIENINIDGDSTFAMMLEAQKRGHTLYHYLTQHLSMRGHDRIYAKAHPVRVRAEKGNHYEFGAMETIDLAKTDVVLMRQDPPFDMSYITATHILEHIHPKTLVVNDPAEVRNAPEKLFVTHFPGLMPPTLITTDRAEIDEFRNEFKDIIIKPLYGNGGAGVFRIKPDDENLGSLHEMFTQRSREPMIVQRYEPAVRAGDKRIILVDGKPAGAILRVPAQGESRANMHVGGKAIKTGLTKREIEICEAIGPELSKRGQIFVGIDVIGDWLTEINVTSPTGIHEVRRFDGTDIAVLIWDAIEKRL